MGLFFGQPPPGGRTLRVPPREPFRAPWVPGDSQVKVCAALGLGSVHYILQFADLWHIDERSCRNTALMIHLQR